MNIRSLSDTSRANNVLSKSKQTKVTNLRCEYLQNPLGIDEKIPRLSWVMDTTRRAARQQSYRILVASSEEKIASGKADLWDSGLVRSLQSTHIEYAGKALKSRDQCYWRVELTDENGDASHSETAFWSMGLLKKDDWSARWITADPQILQRDKDAVRPTLIDAGTPAFFRKTFSSSAQIVRAIIYASARGVFELRLNGKRIGEDLFAPEWTDYHKRIHYRSYDVSAFIEHGGNCIAAILGDGWWSGYVGWQEQRGRYGSLENSLLVQLEVQYIDGTTEIIESDQSWYCNTGPIISSDFMMGEIYDARRERQGWDEANFSSAQDWCSVIEVEAPHVPLNAQRSEAVRVMNEFKAVHINEISPAVFIFDFGQNISGWTRLQVSALTSGTRLSLRYGERLNPDGSLYTENLRRARAMDIYIARGSKQAEIWQSHFTFHGFQYVEISGLPADYVPDLDTLTACAIHSAMDEVGKFSCSHPGVNRLWQNILWSQKDNFISVPTDCPQRDERLGWTGDAQVFLRTATCNMNVAAFFSKWMIDIEDAQTVEGIFPDTAPRLREDINYTGLGNLGGAAGWADAGVIIPFTLWRVYGDRRILERHYSAMLRWIAWIEKHNPDCLRLHELGNNYGDWLCIPSDTSFGTHSLMKYLLATACWADDCSKLSRIADELGHREDALRLQNLFEKIRTAFQKEWLLENGRLRVETQTAYLLALAFDLLPEAQRAQAAVHLVENIRSHDWHLQTGFIGVGHINPQLTLAGYSELAYRLLLQESYPAWLYPVKQGATTIWERWNGWTEEDGFFNPQMNSFNHYSLGSVGEWLFRHVAGIELDSRHAGFQHFVFCPYPGEGLDYASATLDTLYGEIRSYWTRDEDVLVWEIRIPANTSAKVAVPGDAPEKIVLDDCALTEHPLAKELTVRDQRCWLNLEAGVYRFTCL